MFRVSTFLILGVLALFYIGEVYAYPTYYFTTYTEANSACNARKAVKGFGWACDRLNAGSSPTGLIRLDNSYNVIDSDYRWNTGGCPAQYPYIDPSNNNVCTDVPQSDQDCIDGGITELQTDLLDNGVMKICIGTCTVEFNNCKYRELNYNEPGYQLGSCDYFADIPKCTAFYTPIGASDGSSEKQGSQATDTGESTKGGDTLNETTQSPTTTQTDTPNPGDTTQTQTQTETTTTATKDSISVTDTKIEEVSIGTTVVQKTTTTETITYNDGSQDVITTTSFDRLPFTTTTTTGDKQTGDVSTTSTTDSGSSGSTTTTQSFDNSGNNTGTSTQTTGVGGDGKAQYGTPTGNCAPGEKCTVILDGTGLEDIGTTNSKIDAIKGSISAKESELISSITDDEGNNYGIDNVTDFSANTFISKYFTMPSPTCSGGINTTIFGRPFVIEPCQKLQPLRDVLAWVFFILTAFTVIRISFRKVV